LAAGRLDREVEFIRRDVDGLPSGTAAAVEQAFAGLAAEGVLIIVGPAIADNALVVTPLADRYGLPTLHWAGTERARSDFTFQLQVGSHEEEPVLMLQHLRARGVGGRVGVIYDRSEVGRRYFEFLQAEAEVVGMNIAATAGISPSAETVDAQVGDILEMRPEAVIYLGMGHSAPAVARALREADWVGPRLMNAAGLRGHAPDFAPLIDGWIYVDMVADDNRTLLDLQARADISATGIFSAARGYDLGRLAVEGLARAPEHTRAGVRHGLERIKWLPAAEGSEGTLLNLGVQSRGALHGRYLVLRQWRDGRSVQV